MPETPPFGDPDFLRRTLEQYAQAYTGLAAAIQGPQTAAVVEGYRRLFTLPGFAPTSRLNEAGAKFARYQAAVARFSGLVSAISLDAARRFSAALAAEGPGAAPITSLKELHALWIDCGEAAYGEAAHREEFADAQAELLAALVELRAGAA
jgi:hypothetical protein